MTLNSRLRPALESADREDLLNGSALRGPVVHGRARDSQKVSPRGEASRLSVEGQVDVHREILGLLLRRGPSAVFGRVGPVIVDAIDRHRVRRTTPHVGEEVGVAVRPGPALADANSAPTVPRPLWVFRIAAALVDTAPCPMLDRRAVPVRRESPR